MALFHVCGSCHKIVDVRKFGIGGATLGLEGSAGKREMVVHKFCYFCRAEYVVPLRLADPPVAAMLLTYFPGGR